MDQDEAGRLINRLRRVEGQSRGLQRMIEQGRPCEEIFTQLAATKAALDRVGVLLISLKMRECLNEEAGDAGRLPGGSREGPRGLPQVRPLRQVASREAREPRSTPAAGRRRRPTAGPSLVSHVNATHGPGLDASLERLVEPFGGWAAIVSPGERIAVKVNLLRAAPPEKAVTTHPETLGVRAARDQGGRRRALRRRQPRRAQRPRQGRARLQDERHHRGVRRRGRHDRRRRGRPRAARVPGRPALPDRSRPAGRSWTPTPSSRSACSRPTSSCASPAGSSSPTASSPASPRRTCTSRRSAARTSPTCCSTCTSRCGRGSPSSTRIVAMEGQGPGSGTPKELDSLFAARDCVALDCALADRTAHERKSRVHHRRVGAPRPRRPRRPVPPRRRPHRAGPDVQAGPPGHAGAAAAVAAPRWRATSSPRARDSSTPDACIRCNECAAICGARAIAMDPLPDYDDSLCVRCFACTEVCPTAAIDNVSPALVRLFSRGD